MSTFTYPIVAIEGIDGSGKTQLHEPLISGLSSHFGVPFFKAKAPGSTLLGAELRKVLLGYTNDQGVFVAPPKIHNPLVKEALFIADLSEMTHAQILPCLQRGEGVVADRYIASTYCYSIAGCGNTEEDMLNLMQSIIPVSAVHSLSFINLLLDVTIEEARRRTGERHEADAGDMFSDDYYERIRQCYLKLAAERPYRWITLDTMNKNAEEVLAEATILVRERIEAYQAQHNNLERGLIIYNAGTLANAY